MVWPSEDKGLVRRDGLLPRLRRHPLRRGRRQDQVAGLVAARAGLEAARAMRKVAGMGVAPRPTNGLNDSLRTGP